MSIPDVIIIYLALGAPIAMFRFFQYETPFTFWGMTNVLAAFVLWPFTAIKVIAKTPKAEPDASIFVTRKELDVRIIENIDYLKEEILSALGGGGRHVVSPKAEALERYVGLSLADIGSSLSIGKEFFSISGHPDEVVAVRCHARRSLKRLERHRQDSASDVVSAFTDSTDASRTEVRLVEKLAEIAGLLGDRDTFIKLNHLTASHSGSSRSHTLGGGLSSRRIRSNNERSDELNKRAA